MFDGLKNFVNSKFTPKEEDFLKQGYLTPQQFEKAGDQIAELGWKWQKAVSSNKVNKQLPNPEKQFLVMEGRSEKRYKSVALKQSKVVEIDGFLAPQNENQNEIEEETRYFTISITYDSYYHVPRLWITGYDENNKPLTDKQIFEDITSEHEQETVTYEEHPHLNEKQVTIHPCKHGERLKEFVKEAQDRGRKLQPEQALLIFLLFMPSIMPTIEMEGTTDIPLGY